MSSCGHEHAVVAQPPGLLNRVAEECAPFKSRRRHPEYTLILRREYAFGRSCRCVLIDAADPFFDSRYPTLIPRSELGLERLDGGARGPVRVTQRFRQPKRLVGDRLSHPP